MTKPKAYSYIRFSTPEQEKGDSLRRQTEQSEEYAKAHGLVLDSSLRLTDKGLSAFTGFHRTKGALGNFLRLVEHGEIPKGSLLIVENLDRLSRENVLDALSQFTSIIRAGIKVITLCDKKEYDQGSINNNPMNLMMSLVIMARAHEESVIKSERLKSVWKQKRVVASNGRKMAGQCPAWLRLSEDKSEFIVLPERAEVINQIFEMKLAGKGSTWIETQLNEQKGIWKPKNGWRKSYINKLLHNNRELIGEFQSHKKIANDKNKDKYERVPEGDPIPNYFPAITDKKKFNRVQEIIRRNREIKGNAGGRNGTIRNLFTNIVKCGRCGGPMAYLNKGAKPKGGQYLQCDTARRGLGCKSKMMIRYDELEPILLTYCKGLDASEILPGKEKRTSQLSVLRNQLQAIQGELTQVQGKIENVLDSIATTKSKEVRAELDARASSLLTEKAELSEQKADLEVSIDQLMNTGRETEQQLKSIRDLMKHLNRLDVRLNLRSQLRSLLRKITVYPERKSCGVFFQSGERRALTMVGGKVKVLDASAFNKRKVT